MKNNGEKMEKTTTTTTIYETGKPKKTTYKFAKKKCMKKMQIAFEM